MQPKAVALGVCLSLTACGGPSPSAPTPPPGSDRTVTAAVRFGTIAIAAADSLAHLGGDAATVEALFPSSPRKGAIIEALKKITGQSFAKASEWKKWAAENANKQGRRKKDPPPANARSQPD